MRMKETQCRVESLCREAGSQEQISESAVRSTCPDPWRGRMPFAFYLPGYRVGSQPACPETPFTLIRNFKNTSFGHQISAAPFEGWEALFEYG